MATKQFFAIAFTSQTDNGYCPLCGQPVDRSRRMGVAAYTSADPKLRLICDAAAREHTPMFVQMIERADPARTFATQYSRQPAYYVLMAVETVEAVEIEEYVPQANPPTAEKKKPATKPEKPATV